MSEGQRLHPSREQLDAFAQGRLPAELVAEVEEHVATCDSCCRQIQTTPEDTLIQLAREAATLTFHAEQPRQGGIPKPAQIPAELLNHPRYRVLGLVGSGGMGAVYKAQHRLMERLVALKVIGPEFLQNTAAVERFRREFRAVARLSHPNIVTAYDAEQAGSLHFLVMEFVEGLSLDQLVAQRGPLPVRQACELIRQAAVGLAHIHERGMVHRDIKPQNLMVGRDANTLKILDCGLARLSSERRSGPDSAGETTWAGATPVGVVLGTPDYMAPEQSANAAAADIRSDIYSLGCTLYFALTGKPPFPQGSAVEKLLAHAHRQPPPIEPLRADVPPKLARILTRMLTKEPAGRYQKPVDLAAELAAVADPPATPPPLPTAALGPLPTLDDLPSIPTIRPPVVAAKPGHSWNRRSLLVGGLGLGLTAATAPLCVWLLGDGSKSDGGQPASSGGTASGLPRKVLLVIPRYGLWYADYADVKQALESRGIEVVTASSQLAASELAPQSRSGIAMPDMKIDRSVRAADYGAIAFAGLATEEYHPGTPTGAIVGAILQDCQQEQRLITAICGGQKALAAHGQFSGRRVARSQYVAHIYPGSGATLRPTRIERDGLLITAAADTDAEAFAAAIAAAIGP